MRQRKTDRSATRAQLSTPMEGTDWRMPASTARPQVAGQCRSTAIPLGAIGDDSAWSQSGLKSEQLPEEQVELGLADPWH